MSQNSVRIALGAAFLTAAAGVAFYFIRGDAAKPHSPVLGATPAGEAYAALPVPAVPEPSLGWKKPEVVEDNLWTYDLFTPVEVKWNASEKQYEPKGAIPAAVVPFGLKLVSIKHPHYRYKVNALFEGNTPAESVVVFGDEIGGSPVRGRIGQTVGPDGGKITILGYDNKPVKQADGSTRRPLIVRVKDLTLAKELAITPEVIEFTDRTLITLAADSGEPWNAEKVGAKFSNDAGSYVIKGIDFENRTVTVEKTYEDSVKKTKKKVVETLSVSAPAAPAPANGAKK